jgi:hypothetical protein
MQLYNFIRRCFSNIVPVLAEDTETSVLPMLFLANCLSLIMEIVYIQKMVCMLNVQFQGDSLAGINLFYAVRNLFLNSYISPVSTSKYCNSLSAFAVSAFPVLSAKL